MSDNDDIIFADETQEEPTISIRHKWKLLVVDDDDFVHKVTAMVLQDYTFEGCGIEILDAYSAKEGMKLLAENPDTAVILLDVVMETSQAGLDMAAWIRDELKNTMVRIILRTGQPGEAPEQEVIFKYDINDYKEKSELTSQKLATTVTTAIRSYRDIRTIERNRRGLARIVSASPTIFKMQSMGEFASGVLQQLTSTVCREDDSLVARASGLAAARKDGDFEVIASTGRFSGSQGQDLNSLSDPAAIAAIQQAAQRKESFFTDDAFVGYYKTLSGSESIIYLGGIKLASEEDQQLIEIFSTNISAAFDNIDLNRMISETQREMLFTLGEVVETRSSETANHVRRVAEYSHLLAVKSGMSEEEANLLKMASPMHDVGKIGIPDSVLLKPGKLTEAEFEVMKTHAQLGHDILKGSARSVLRTAATVAREHHERWDGNGYPLGLSGEDISLAGRITMLADIFDALGCKRVYKDAWPIEKILDYIQQNAGTLFDPDLVGIFMENLDEILAIREQHRDLD